VASSVDGSTDEFPLPVEAGEAPSSADDRYVIELLDADGRLLERHRLTEGTVEVGRSYACDVVVDDPFLCPAHVRLSADGGGVRLRNLSVVNGVIDRSGGRVEELTLTDDAEFRIGSTQLRIRSIDRPMEPARVHSAVVPQKTPSRWRRVVATLAAVLLLVLWQSWVESVHFLKWEDILLACAGVLGAIGFWAGTWGVFSRIFRKSSFFLDHVWIVSVAILVSTVWDKASSWAVFWSAADRPFWYLNLGFVALFVAVMLYAHLSRVSPRVSRPLSIAVGVGIVALVLLVSYRDRDDFEGYPSHPSVLKPVPAGLLPTTSMDAVFKKAEKIQERLDEEVEEALEESRESQRNAKRETDASAAPPLEE